MIAMADLFEFSWGGVEIVSMLFNEATMLGYQQKRHFMGVANTESVLLNQGLRSSWYNLEREVRKSEESSRNFLSKRTLERALEGSVKRQRDYWKFIYRVHTTDYSRENDGQIIADIRGLVWHLKGITAGYNVTQPEFLKIPEQELKRIITESRMDLENTFSALTTYPRIDAINLEETDFLKLCGGDMSPQELDSHIGKHPWIMLNTFDRSHAHEYLHARAKSKSAAKGMDLLLAEKKVLKQRQKQILEALGDPLASYLSSLFQELAFNRVKEKTCWASAAWLAAPLYSEISRRTGETFSNLANYYRCQELEAAVVNREGISPQETEARNKIYLFHYKHPHLHFYSGEQALRAKQELLAGLDISQSLQEFKGTCASVGKAVGRVHIIITAGLDDYMQELYKFKEGEVLVTGMTQITMTPICTRAAAIVTNEGGISSHAAIISRELKIPCIVGTKVATRELKDGDLVEVDATNGVVRVLKRGS